MLGDNSYNFYLNNWCDIKPNQWVDLPMPSRIISQLKSLVQHN